MSMTGGLRRGHLCGRVSWQPSPALPSWAGLGHWPRASRDEILSASLSIQRVGTLGSAQVWIKSVSRLEPPESDTDIPTAHLLPCPALGHPGTLSTGKQRDITPPEPWGRINLGTTMETRKVLPGKRRNLAMSLGTLEVFFLLFICSFP